MRILGLALNLLYAALLSALSPWIAWRMATQGRHRRGWRAKLWGALPLRTDDARPLVWLHAVSVGEVLLLQRIVRELQAERPEVQILITTGTDTGHAVAREKLAGCTVSWLPLDFTWAVRRALARVRPDAFALVELELWPNLIAAVGAAGIPLLLLNGRLSERSARGYRRIRPLISRLLQEFDCLAVQTEEYARRFRELGAPAERVHVTGSLKFDGVESDRNHPAVERLRSAFQLDSDSLVFVAGSTIDGEEEAALEAWEAVRPGHPELRLILVPRHQERFDEVARLVEKRGHALLRRTRALDDCRPQVAADSVLLLDTLGELSACWGLADFAFVGGSLTGRRGGQNMIEPAAYGAAVMFGPHTRNFRSAVDSLLAVQAAVVVESSGDISDQLRWMLQRPREAAAMGARARLAVLRQQGATAETLRMLVNGLPAGPKVTRRAA
jgi:3-deoxy-D-manno-octulosonic-acid transferase